MSSLLLPRIAAGDAAAIDEFVRRHGNAVWGLARQSCRNVQDAEDLTQEILLDVWKSADRFDPEQGSELTFVMTIAKRRLIDRLRRAGRRPSIELLEASEQLAADEDPDHVELRDEVRRAQEALQQLRPEQRDVLEQALALGRTHQEIAAAIGIPLGTVKSHARRGLLKLRAMLGVHVEAGGNERGASDGDGGAR